MRACSNLNRILSSWDGHCEPCMQVISYAEFIPVMLSLLASAKPLRDVDDGSRAA